MVGTSYAANSNCCWPWFNFLVYRMDHSYYKNRIPRETETSWLGAGQKFPGNWSFSSRSDEFQGLRKMQKWESLSHIWRICHIPTVKTRHLLSVTQPYPALSKGFYTDPQGFAHNYCWLNGLRADSWTNSFS